LHLFFQADRTIVIKHTSKNVAVLNNSDKLFDVFSTGLQQNSLEELLVVVKLKGDIKLWLKVFPNSMVFRDGRPE